MDYNQKENCTNLQGGDSCTAVHDVVLALTGCSASGYKLVGQRQLFTGNTEIYCVPCSGSSGNQVCYDSCTLDPGASCGVPGSRSDDKIRMIYKPKCTFGTATLIESEGYGECSGCYKYTCPPAPPPSPPPPPCSTRIAESIHQTCPHAIRCDLFCRFSYQMESKGSLVQYEYFYKICPLDARETCTWYNA